MRPSVADLSEKGASNANDRCDPDRSAACARLTRRGRALSPPDRDEHLRFLCTQTLIVSGDAGATAAKILASETLFRLAIVASLIATLAFIFLGRALYRLLHAVDKPRAVLMVTLVLLTIPLSFLTALNQVAALTILHSGAALSGFGIGQINALSMLFLELSSNVSSVNAIFFGLWLFPFGFLAIRSGFIPRIVGVLVLVAGGAYLVGSLNFLLSPPFRGAVTALATVGYVGELAAVGWLAVQAIKLQFRKQRLPA